MAKKVELTCDVCGAKFLRLPYEVKRNAELGRANLHDRNCQAVWMNMSPAKQQQTKAMLAERNANQWRADNPNWKGGISKLKPLPETDSDDVKVVHCPNCGSIWMGDGPVSMEKDYYCPNCDTHFDEEEHSSGPRIQTD